MTPSVLIQGGAFEIETLCSMLQNPSHFSSARILKYLTNFDMEDVKLVIDVEVEGYPAIYFAVKRDCIKCAQTILDYGADPNARAVNNVPVLAFAVIHAVHRRLQTIKMVKLPLTFGADPASIPRDMWEDSTLQPTQLATSNDPTAQWCTPDHRNALATTLNLSQRYFLLKASLQQRPSGRTSQLARLHKLMGIFTVPYQLIGQTYASASIQQEILSHVLEGERKSIADLESFF